MNALLQICGGFSTLGIYLAKIAHNGKVGQVVTLLLGIVICLSAYTSIFLVGPTMLPVLDTLHISREKVRMGRFT